MINGYKFFFLFSHKLFFFITIPNYKCRKGWNRYTHGETNFKELCIYTPIYIYVCIWRREKGGVQWKQGLKWVWPCSNGRGDTTASSYLKSATDRWLVFCVLCPFPFQFLTCLRSATSITRLVRLLVRFESYI